MNKYKSILPLLFIIILSFLIRVINLGNLPLGFTWDEAALGYNSYSLIQTGKDEHGQLMPIVFRSFGDYKPGLYVYLSNVSILLFGLNEFATRLPSAIFGTISVLLIYLLVLKLSNNKIWALSSSFIASINPWMIHFSRGAWESNINVTLVLVATLLWIKKRYSYSALFFGLTLFTYQSSKMFTPMLIVLLVILNFKIIFSKKLIAPLIIFFVFALPLILGYQSQSGRLKVFSLFSYRRTDEEIKTILSAHNSDSLSLQYYVFNSEVLQYIRTFLLHYFNHYSPRYLFMTGDFSSQRHSTPFYGYFHLFEVLSIGIGLVGLAKYKRKYLQTFVFLLLLISPIPASLSRDLVSGVRSLMLSVPLILISGLGLSILYKNKLIYLLSIFSLLLGFFYYLDLYSVHSKFYTSGEWLAPYKQAMQIIVKNKDNYSNIYITDKLGQPYIFLLFYGKINPNDYQNKSKIEINNYGDVDRVLSFDKYKFGPIYWPEKRGDSDSLYLGGIYELPEQDLQIPNLIRLGDVKLSNGQSFFRLVAQP